MQTIKEKPPSLFFLNPVCSIWKEPLLTARYHFQYQTWQIEQGCHTRHIMPHLDQTRIETYRLDKKYFKQIQAHSTSSSSMLYAGQVF